MPFHLENNHRTGVDAIQGVVLGGIRPLVAAGGFRNTTDSAIVSPGDLEWQSTSSRQ